MKRTPKPTDLHRVHQYILRKPMEGLPAVIGEWVYTHADTSRPYPYACEEERTLWLVAQSLGLYGIGPHVFAPTQPPARVSNERRAAMRLGALRRRIERRYPLFAESMIAEEIARRPSYYAGEVQNEEARTQVEEQWHADWNRWQAKAKAPQL